MTEMIQNILACLRALRVRPGENEYEIHRQIASCLAEGGFRAVHEARLAPRLRVDFLVEGIAIEVKKNRGERAKLLRQLDRYLAAPQVEALIVVTAGGLDLPAQLQNKPLISFSLSRLWGIALP